MSDKFRILLVPDSFKGSLRADDVCKYLRKGLERSGFSYHITEIPMSDGGEGLVQSLVVARGGQFHTIPVHDPLMRPVDAQYGLIDEGHTAVIEMAAASGLELLKPPEYNPLKTTTLGTGELILDALDRGCRKFIIGIGGSATNDGGAGMLEALGVRLLNHQNQLVQERGGGALAGIDALDDSQLDRRLQECEIQIACDVTNPLTGPRGATFVYGKQKGAKKADLDILENGMVHWGRILEGYTGRNINEVPGSGAAGGLGAGFLALSGAVLRSGFEIVTEATDLESLIERSDLIVTGEGRVDDQTLNGKVVSGIGGLAKHFGKPLICVAGALGPGSEILLKYGVSALFSIVNQPMGLEVAMERAPQLLEATGRNIGSLIGDLQEFPRQD